MGIDDASQGPLPSTRPWPSSCRSTRGDGRLSFEAHSLTKASAEICSVTHSKEIPGLKAPNHQQWKDQGRESNPNPSFLVWMISSGGVGVFWGPKSSVFPSKPRQTKCFGGISRDFCRDILGVPEKLEKKSLCAILVP